MQFTHNIAIVLLSVVVLAGVAALLDERPPSYVAVPVAYVVSWVLLGAARQWWKWREPTVLDQSDLERVVANPPRPVSGPIGRFGTWGLMAVFSATELLCLLNPRQVKEMRRQAAGNRMLARRLGRSGEDGSDYRTRIDYSLPFDEEWLVANGGRTPETSHSWDVLGQRYALDFIQVDACLRSHRGRGTRAEDYFCFGREIRAAADGVVVRVENRVRQAFLGWGVCDFTARSIFGNHVMVAHAEGEFGLYAHLVRGSVAVGPGDRVRRGEVLGRCGHTGNSTEPHLHFHLQDSGDLFTGMGLPVRFSKVVVDGEGADGVVLSAGQRVSRR